MILTRTALVASIAVALCAASPVTFAADAAAGAKPTKEERAAARKARRAAAAKMNKDAIKPGAGQSAGDKPGQTK
jgi:hypothetical protein